MLRDRHRIATFILCAMALGQALVCAPARAVPMVPGVEVNETQAIAVEISQPTPSVAGDGTLHIDVAVSAAAPAEYLEVRLRLKSPSGRLVYQKTEVRSNLSTGRHVIEYERDLAPLDLSQGRYPIEVRVLASGAQATSATGRVLVVSPNSPRLPVAVVVTAVGTPAITMGGLFSRDPAYDSRLAEDLSFVTQLARNREVPLALAVPPVLLEQFARAAAGYETTSGISFSSTEEPAVHAERVLQGLRSAIDTGTVDLIDVPYALPDLAGLARIEGEEDLLSHWARTDAASASILRSADPRKAAYIGEVLTAGALRSLADRNVPCVLAPASALRSGDTTATPGCYTVRGQSVHVLVVDEAAALGAHDGADAFYDALFDRLEDGGPVVVMLELGEGGANSAVDVQHALDWIADTTWLRTADVASLWRADDAPVASLAPAPDSDAPVSYWPEIERSRSATLAYASATGEQDADASAAMRALLVAESALWSGADGSWAQAAGGQALAREALDYVTAQFSLIRLDAKDVTLSGSRGDVPLTLVNNTGKPLHLTLVATSEGTLPLAPSQEIDVQPTQNFLTLPVDLGNALSGEVNVAVRAGTVTVAEGRVHVRASYIDRLATVGMVIVVLAVLLVFIRRRVANPAGGAIVEGPKHPRRPSDGE